MKDVGLVVYRKNPDTGDLIAKWCHSDSDSGTGLAKGAPGEDYCGDYQITYFDADRNEVARLELQIRRSLEQYLVTWLKDGKVRSQGIGMLTEVGLAVGYRDLA